MVEHRLPKPVVAGSIPVSRSVLTINGCGPLVPYASTGLQFLPDGVRDAVWG